MPQDGRSADEKKANSRPDTRSPAEKALFLHMLKNVNLLYLGCSVLCLIDISYLSRFWTQFEAWLSMQQATTGKLCRASGSERRETIVTIYNGTQTAVQLLLEQWADVTPEQVLHPGRCAQRFRAVQLGFTAAWV